MNEAEYKEHIDRLVLDINDNSKHYPTADEVAKKLVFGMDDNTRVYAIAHSALKIAPEKVKRAEAKIQKELEQAAKKAEELDEQSEATKRVIAAIGCYPKTEREYVAAFMKRYVMHYSGAFYRQNVSIKTSEVSADLLLTASDLALVKPRGELLSVPAIALALEEWIARQQQQRKEAVWDIIASLPAGMDAEAVLKGFHAVCEAYFKEPVFAMAAIIKGIWQVKRKMTGLTIIAHHMVVLQGLEQGGGKTTFIRKLLGPVKEVSGESDASQVVDDRSTGLRELYAVFVDELAKAERVDVTKLKNLITGEVLTSRILYSHNTQQTPINMTLFGSINKPLGTIVYDTSGMRRFIEIQPKERAEIEPNWHLIEDFNWLSLWQAIDHTAADPMTPFNEELKQKQEEMRFKDNVEEWLNSFEFNKMTSNVKEHVDGHRADFYASELFKKFNEWEVEYCPASKGTSLQMWGRTMKALIDENKWQDWSYHQEGPKRIYRIALSNVVALASPPMTMAEKMAKICHSR